MKSKNIKPDWYKVWFGCFRHFEIFANNPKNAKSRFCTLSRLGLTKGFKPERITHITN